jgi:hypothetical protein
MALEKIRSGELAQFVGHTLMYFSAVCAIGEAFIAYAFFGMSVTGPLGLFFAVGALLYIAAQIAFLFPPASPWEHIAHNCFLGRQTDQYQDKPVYKRAPRIIMIYDDFRNSLDSQRATLVLLMNHYQATLGYAGGVTIKPNGVRDDDMTFFVRWELADGRQLPTVEWRRGMPHPEQIETSPIRSRWAAGPTTSTEPRVRRSCAPRSGRPSAASSFLPGKSQCCCWRAKPATVLRAEALYAVVALRLFRKVRQVRGGPATRPLTFRCKFPVEAL